MASRTWRNWSRIQQCAPARIHKPISEDELVRIVKRAAQDGDRVKAVGAGHSFTGIALTNGHLLDLSDHNTVLSADPDNRTVTVQSGIPLHQLNEELWDRGLAMQNLGDIAYQSIAGAVATATHGTGIRFGGIATQITGLRIIAADGSVIECSADKEPDVFNAARVGLGALGLVSAVTLKCEDAFNLHAIEGPERVDDVLANLDENVAANEHFEFFWVPHTGWALTKRNNRTTEPARPRGRWREFRDDIIYNNLLFGIVCRVGRIRPSLAPTVARAMPSSGRVEYIGRSYRVFASPRLVRFYEMEYSIPIEAAQEAFNRVREYVAQSGMMITFPVEVRFTKGDDIPLSTANGRDSCYIAIHVFEGTPYQQYFAAVEDIMDDYGGRPHWGKLHFQKAETLAPRYADWDAFQTVRKRLDPDGMFSNPYLDQVLGRIGDA
jgi:L-gulonolactone oxidase